MQGTSEKIYPDLEFIVQALRNSRRVQLNGVIRGEVIMTPPGAKLMRDFPREAECLYKIAGLFDRAALQLQAMSQHFDGSTIWDAILYHGFPEVCLKCGKPMTRYELLVRPVSNGQSWAGLRLSGENAQEIFDVLFNTRNFLAVPRCSEHSLVDTFFYKDRFMFTSDADVAEVCKAHSENFRGRAPFIQEVVVQRGNWGTPEQVKKMNSFGGRIKSWLLKL